MTFLKPLKGIELSDNVVNFVIIRVGLSWLPGDIIGKVKCKIMK